MITIPNIDIRNKFDVTLEDGTNIHMIDNCMTVKFGNNDYPIVFTAGDQIIRPSFDFGNLVSATDNDGTIIHRYKYAKVTWYKRNPDTENVQYIDFIATICSPDVKSVKSIRPAVNTVRLVKRYADGTVEIHIEDTNRHCRKVVYTDQSDVPTVENYIRKVHHKKK